MNADPNTLRSYLLTDREARIVSEALGVAASAAAMHGTDDTLVLELRDRFTPYDDTDDCPRCQGTGKSNPIIPMRSGPPPCVWCDGTGKRKDAA